LEKKLQKPAFSIVASAIECSRRVSDPARRERVAKVSAFARIGVRR
jgi:hypothetical protein